MRVFFCGCLQDLASPCAMNCLLIRSQQQCSCYADTMSWNLARNFSIQGISWGSFHSNLFFKVSAKLSILLCVSSFFQVCGQSSTSKFAEALATAVSQLGFKHGLVPKLEQRAGVKSVYEGKDVFLRLPTGFGKSLQAVLWTVALPIRPYKLGRQPCSSVVIVISPLISLMVDQMVCLRSRGVKAAIVRGGDGVRADFIAAEEDQPASLLYCAPEATLRSWWYGEIETSAS